MSDAPEVGKRTGRLWMAAGLLAIAGFGARVYHVESSKAAPSLPLTSPVDDFLAALDHRERDAEGLAKATHNLLSGAWDSRKIVQAFPRVLDIMGDDAEPVRFAAAAIVGELIARWGWTGLLAAAEEASGSDFCSDAEEALEPLLDDPSPRVREASARSLANVALRGALEEPPARLVACLDDEEADVRIAAASTLIDYIHGPERIVPVALRRFAAEGPAVRKAFGEVFRNSRLGPSTLPLLLEGLSQEDPEICLNCASAIDRMGLDAAPALPAMLALIRRELERPRPARRDDITDILGTAADAVGQIRPEGDAPAEAVDLLCRILEQAFASLDADAHRAGPKSIEGASLDALAAKTRLDRRIQGSIWSLGMIGPGASKALPRLLALYEPPPAGLAEPRGLLAEALAEIARTTPDRSRILGRLVESWSTASPHDRAPLARALRRLDPDADRLVPELKHQSKVVSLPPFRRHRFARSRREYTHF